MKLALAQINTTVGDLAGNVGRSVEAVNTAHRQGADLVVLPEMKTPGF
jgi:NAD+ synthase (glutamine-hydrolysing)